MAATSGGRRRRALTTLALLAAFVTIVAGAGAQDQDLLDYEPGSVASGDPLRVFGRTPDDCGGTFRVHLFLNGVLLDSIQTEEGTGNFDTVVQIPEDIPEPEFGAPNTLWISCNDDGTDELAVRTLAITEPAPGGPELTVSPTQGPAGTEITIAGSGHFCTPLGGALGPEENAATQAGFPVYFFLHGVGLDVVEPLGEALEVIESLESVTFELVVVLPELDPREGYEGPALIVSSCDPSGQPPVASVEFVVGRAEDGPPSGPALQSVVPFFEGTPTGPPGMRIVFVGTMQRDCDDLYLFFDGERAGEGVVHADRRSFSSGRLKVPYGAEEGEHTVTSSCSRSGEPAEGTLPFLVDADAVDNGLDHRSLFSRSVLSPQEVSRDLGHIVRNLLLALLFLGLILFPAELFNSTLEEHYEEVKGWFGPIGRFFAALGRGAGGMPGWLSLLIFGAVAAAIYGFLDPEFGGDRDSIVLFVGMALGILAVSLAFDLPSIFFVKARHGVSGAINVLPGTLIVAVLCVVASRLVDFQPGYFYGAIAGTVFAGTMADKDDGRATAFGAAVMFIISLIAWFVWIPVKEAAGDPQASIVFLIGDVMLATIFVAGLESMIFGLIPMRNLDGESVVKWNKIGWAVLFGLGVFGFVHVLLNPAVGYVNFNPATVWSGVVLFGAFGLFSVSFWAYFRFKGSEEPPEGSVG